MDIVLAGLTTEAQKDCSCGCGIVTLGFYNAKIDVKTCWFTVTPNHIGGPFNTAEEMKKLKLGEINAVSCPRVQVSQETLGSAIALVLFVARVQHALTNLLGDKFTSDVASVIPSYDLFELLCFKTKNSSSATLARELMGFWNVSFSITANAASELYHLRTEIGRGLCVMLSGIHCAIENQRLGRPPTGGPVTVTQLFYSFSWMPRLYGARFAIMANNPSAALAIANNPKLLTESRALSLQEVADLALMTCTLYPLEYVAKAALQFAGVSVPDNPSGLSSSNSDDVDEFWAGLAIKLLTEKEITRKVNKTSVEVAKPDVNMVLSGTGRPLLFFANNRYVATALLDAGANINATDDQGRGATGVIRAPAVLELLTERGSNLLDIGKAADGGAAALHAAVRDGKTDMVTRLVQVAGVNVDSTVGDMPALIMASSLEMLTLLVDTLGADLSKKYTTEGLTYLHLAARLNRPKDMLKFVVDSKKVDVNEGSVPSGLTPLMNARSIPTVEALLDLGADPEAKDVQGMTVLSALLAAQMDAAPLVRLLVKAHLKNQSDQKPSLAALVEGTDEYESTIKEMCKDMVNARNADGHNALLSCSSAQQVKDVLEHGAEAMPFGPLSIPPVSFFTFHSNGPCVAELLRTLLDRPGHENAANERDSLGKTPLMYAKSPVIAQLLIVCGADVNATCHEGLSVLGHILSSAREVDDFDEATLIAIASSGKLEELTPERGASNDLGLTELMLVSSASQVAFLTRMGAKVDVECTLNGCNAVAAAAASGASAALRQLLVTLATDKNSSTNQLSVGVEGGSDALVRAFLNKPMIPQVGRNSFQNRLMRPLVNLFCPVDSWKESVWTFSEMPMHIAVPGMTPLMWCRKAVDFTTMESVGANVATMKTPSGLTVLHFAAARGDEEIVREVVRAAMSSLKSAEQARKYLSEEDSRGFTALDLALVAGHTRIAEVLTKLGGKKGSAWES